ncbi:unnamed protein product, partial [Closterium sp. NIES-54]
DFSPLCVAAWYQLPGAATLECSDFRGRGGSPLLGIGPVESLADGGGLDQLLVTPYGDSEAKDAKAREVGFGCGGNFDHVVVVAKDVAKGVAGGVVTGIIVHGFSYLYPTLC